MKMKRSLVAAATVVALVALLLAPPPSRAWIATEVTQILNNIELIATVAALYDQIQRMDQNLEALGGIVLNDRSGYFAQLNELAARGALSYAAPNAADFYQEAFPSYLAFTPEVLEVIDARGLTRLWQSETLQTFAGNLDAAAQQGAEEVQSERDRQSLTLRLGTATGNLTALQVLGEAQLHTAQEVSRLNQLLAGILSNQTAYFGQTMANRGTREATERYLLDEALLLLPAPGVMNAYDDTQGFTGLPAGSELIVRSFAVLAVVVTAVLLPACQRADPCAPDAEPLEDLRCAQPAEPYGAAFWTTEAEAGSELWEEAERRCAEEENASEGRCKTIAQVELVLGMRREAEEARRRLGVIGGAEAGPVADGRPSGEGHGSGRYEEDPESRPSGSSAGEGFTGIPSDLPDPAAAAAPADPPTDDDGS